MALYAGGVDVGSTQTKGIILDDQARIVGRGLIDTGANVVKAAEKVYAVTLADAGLRAEDVGYVVGTGYGRYKVTFGNTQITEISCHSKGAQFIFPKTRTLLDIGGQDTKAIRVNDLGEAINFSMNDKCAAGTGRFLGAAAKTLDLSLNDLGPISLSGQAPVRITTVCTVFVESEIIAYLAQGKKIEDILRGMHNAIAARSIALLRRVGIDDELTFTGGVSRNTGMVHALEDSLKMKINVSEESHYMGAIGAALFSLERAQKLAVVA